MKSLLMVTILAFAGCDGQEPSHNPPEPMPKGEDGSGDVIASDAGGIAYPRERYEEINENVFYAEHT